MDFTEIFKQTSGIVAFSPGTRFILTAIHDRLVIRQADTLQITRSWQIPTEAAPLQSSSKGSNVVKSTNQSNQSEMVISHASWSCDSEYILAACAKRGTIDVFKLRDESWNSRITVGAEGLTKAEWAPDGRTIVCFSAWALRVTIWSLVTGTSTYIQYPLHPDRGCAFRPDGRYFVLAERHKSKDTMGVYDATESYRLVRHFPLPTSTLSSFSLSPNGDYLAAWESPMEYKIYILSLSGLVAGSFTPDPDPGYGIRCVSWHPTGFFLAVGGYDDKIYLLERLTWEPIAILDLQTRIGNSINIWREPPEWMEKTQGRGFLSYERLRPPYSIGINRPDFSKSHPKSGVVQLSFNISGTLLLARFESAPTAVFLYSLPSASEGNLPTRPEVSPSTAPKLRSVLIHADPVVAAKWNPVRKANLVITCGSGSIYLWSDEWIKDEETGETEEVAECVGIPARQFNTLDLQWAPDGKGILLLDKEAFCCAFEVEDEGT